MSMILMLSTRYDLSQNVWESNKDPMSFQMVSLNPIQVTTPHEIAIENTEDII